MNLGGMLHGGPDARTAGLTIGHGPGYEVFAEVFFAGRRRRVYTELARLSGARPGDRVLDVGCGTGYLTRLMAQAVGTAGTALGIDPSPQVIEHARGHAGLPNCAFADGIAEDLDAPDGSFDVVVTSLAIHHLPEAVRGRALGEMHRVLRPGGRVLVADFRPPTGRIGRHLVGALTGPAMQHNPVHLLEPLVAEAGFVPLGSGGLRPWIHYVRGAKPEDAG